MPTVILLDNSLSMYQSNTSSRQEATTKQDNQSNNLTKRDLSSRIVRKLTEYLSQHFSHEKLALVIESSEYIKS